MDDVIVSVSTMKTKRNTFLSQGKFGHCIDKQTREIEIVSIIE